MKQSKEHFKENKSLKRPNLLCKNVLCQKRSYMIVVLLSFKEYGSTKEKIRAVAIITYKILID